MFRTDFIAMIDRMLILPVKPQYLFLCTSTGRLVGCQIFESIFVIKWPHPKVNQNIHSKLTLTSLLLIPPYVFRVLGRAKIGVQHRNNLMHFDLNSSIAYTLWSSANAPEPFSQKNESVHHTLGKEHPSSKIIDNY